MTQGYTPTDNDVKADYARAFCSARNTRHWLENSIKGERAFNRWLAAHDAQIRAAEHVKALELSDDETQIFANGIHAFTHEWGSFLDCDLEIGLDAVAEHRKEQQQ